MEKPSPASTALGSLMIPLLAAALAVQSCAGAESPKTGGATGGGSASTGGRSGSTGGSSFGSGGSSSTSTGGNSSGSGGNSGFGTGGSSGFGTGGGTIIGGGTGGAAVTGGFAVANGYVTGAGWMGYGYTYVGPMVGSKATITPATFEGLTQLCATGSIAADPTFASVAGMGFSVNQANTPMPPILTAPTSGTGLSINVSVTGLTLAPGAGSQLRAQLKSAGGDFCAPIPAAGTSTIPWASFNKTCWDTTAVGNAAFVAGTAITAVEVLVPSAMTAIPTFMVCLLDAHAK